MTEEAVAVEGLGTELAPDDVFAKLVHVTNTSAVEMGVTLHVRGQMVTGRLISGATYWRESAAQLRESGTGPSELLDVVAESMEGVAETYEAAYANDGSAADDPSQGAFLHLRNAHTLGPQGPTPTDGTLWRGRLASVDGFTFGELTGVS